MWIKAGTDVERVYSRRVGSASSIIELVVFIYRVAEERDREFGRRRGGIDGAGAVRPDEVWDAIDVDFDQQTRVLENVGAESEGGDDSARRRDDDRASGDDRARADPVDAFDERWGKSYFRKGSDDLLQPFEQLA
jgi:hypothetical protein